MREEENRLASMGIRAVQSYALASGVPTQSRELPSLEPTLIFNTGAPISIVDAAGHTLEVQTGQAFYAGLHHRYCFSRARGAQSGVHIRMSPQAAWRIIGAGVADCADRAVLVSDVADGRLAAALSRHGPPDPNGSREAVIALLNEAMVDAPEPGMEIVWAIGQLAKPGVKVGTIAAELGWSRRRLIAHCRQTLGITPKAFARIARYRRLLTTLEGGRESWAARAIDAGYFDQSHMIRDFTAFTGMSPASYLGESVRFVQ